MAIALDSVHTSSSSLASGTPNDVTINAGAGNGRKFILTSAQENAGVITSVTLDGKPLTQVAGARSEHPDNNTNVTDMWEILDADMPAAAGTYDLVVNGASMYRQSICYTGVKQELSQDSDAKNGAGVTSLTSKSMTVAAAGSKLLSVAMINSGNTWLDVAGQTKRYSNDGLLTSAYDWSVYDKDVDANGTITNETQNSATRMVQSSIVLAPVPTGGSGPEITNVSPASPPNEHVGVNISGTGFGATQGTVTYDGIALNVTSWTDTAITVNWPDLAVDGGTRRFLTNYDLTVTPA